MAWRSVTPMEERIRFVLEAQLDLWTINELCQRYGISRKTGYKWLKRFETGGLKAMHELSRAPKHRPGSVAKEVVEAIIAKKKRHRNWGPKKIAFILGRECAELKVPAPSTIGNILDRAGMVKKRRKRRAGGLKRWPVNLTPGQYPNHVWGVDFKGWFRTRDGQRCEPFTTSDLYSRFVLECKALESQESSLVEPVFKNMFSRYGLPEIIRVDNGAPFASQGPLGLSRLSMWWVQLGIRVEFIEPGHPEQNAVHERMHRTLKEDACCPPEADLGWQQQRFERWRQEFNFERPHEAIAMKCPAELYSASARSFPAKLPDFEYPACYEVRRVKKSGQIVFEGVARFIGRSFTSVLLGLEAISHECYLVHAGPLVLGVLKRNSNLPMALTVDLPQLEN